MATEIKYTTLPSLTCPYCKTKSYHHQDGMMSFSQWGEKRMLKVYFSCSHCHEEFTEVYDCKYSGTEYNEFK